MTTLTPAVVSDPALAPAAKPLSAYEAPAIVHKAELKHFSGSPLATDPNAPDLLGLPH